MADVSPSIEALLSEERRFPPSQEFIDQANVSDPDVYQRADADYEGFWESWAEELHWFEKWDKVLQWDPPFAQWFLGGKTNISYNCLDRHLEGAAPQQGRHRVGGRAGRLAGLYLRRPAPGSVPLCQRTEEPWGEEGRQGNDLHAHDTGACHCHARLRPHRRASQHRFWRLQP